MNRQPSEVDAPQRAPFERKKRPRFTVRLLFLLIAIVAAGAAYLFQPQIVHSVTVDLARFDAYQQQVAGGVLVGPGTSAAEDHCIRIRSSRIIAEAMGRSDELKGFMARQSTEPVRWVYDHLRVIPVGDDRVRIDVNGDAADKQQLQELANALAVCYLEFLGQVVDTSTGESADAGDVTDQDTTWTVNFRW